MLGENIHLRKPRSLRRTKVKCCLTPSREPAGRAGCPQPAANVARTAIPPPTPRRGEDTGSLPVSLVHGPDAQSGDLGDPLQSGKRAVGQSGSRAVQNSAAGALKKQSFCGNFRTPRREGEAPAEPQLSPALRGFQRTLTLPEARFFKNLFCHFKNRWAELPISSGTRRKSSPNPSFPREDGKLAPEYWTVGGNLMFLLVEPMLPRESLTFSPSNRNFPPEDTLFAHQSGDFRGKNGLWLRNSMLPVESRIFACKNSGFPVPPKPHCESIWHCRSQL